MCSAPVKGSCRPRRIPGAGADYMSVHFTDEETEAQRGNVTHRKCPIHRPWGGRAVGARVLGTLATLFHCPVPFLPQRASCSPGTTSPTSATFQATSCAATAGASPAPGSATGCPTASTRVTRKSAVSGPALCWGCGGGLSWGVSGEFPPVSVCQLRGSGLWPAVLPAPPVTRSWSNAVSAEAGVLVWWEPQLWGSRGPFHQTLLTPTLGSSCCLPFIRGMLRFPEVE